MERGGMGERIGYADGQWVVPDHPIIPFIEGDGTGPDIWRAARRVFDAALEKTPGKKRRVEWLEVVAGEKAVKATGNWRPHATRDQSRRDRGAIQGPRPAPGRGRSASRQDTLL